METAWFGDVGLFLLGSAAIVAAIGYFRQQGKRYSYREWRRDIEWKLARLDAVARIAPHGGAKAKIVATYLEALDRLDDLELKMRALEGPEPGPPGIPDVPKSD